MPVYTQYDIFGVKINFYIHLGPKLELNFIHIPPFGDFSQGSCILKKKTFIAQKMQKLCKNVTNYQVFNKIIRSMIDLLMISLVIPIC